MKEESQNDTIDNDASPLLQPPELQELQWLETTKVDDEEQDKESAACCRICLESDSSSAENDLISPCMCKGTQQFVHRECLDHWRSVKEGFAFSHCTTCKAQFHLQPQISEDNSWRKVKFRLFVARDVILVFLAVQGIIAALALAVYLVDSDGQFRNSFSNGWDRLLSKHPAAFYYCAGVFMFFVILGISGLVVHCCSGSNNDPCMAGSRHCCYGWGIPASVEACGVLLVIFVVIFAILGIAYGLLAATLAIQRIWQRHYHILTKRELTKEYIVQDLHGNYSPPKLDPEHEERLRALKLL